MTLYFAHLLHSYLSPISWIGWLILTKWIARESFPHDITMHRTHEDICNATALNTTFLLLLSVLPLLSFIFLLCCPFYLHTAAYPHALTIVLMCMCLWPIACDERHRSHEQAGDQGSVVLRESHCLLWPVWAWGTKSVSDTKVPLLPTFGALVWTSFHPNLSSLK